MLLGLAACGGDGDEPVVPDAAPPPDLTRCASWTATPSRALTPVDGASSMFPKLVWHGDGYGLVWYDERGGDNNAFFAALSAEGDVLGEPIQITTESQIAETPQMAASGDGFGVVWSEFRDGNSEIYAARLGRDGHKLAPDVNLSRSPTSSTRPTIAATATGWTVAWVEALDTPAPIERVQVIELSPDGVPDGDATWLSLEGRQAYAPDAASDGQRVRVAWHAIDDDQIWSSPAAAPATAAALGTTGRVPVLAWGDGQWGVVYHALRGPNWTVHFARLDAAGVLLGETQLSDGTVYATFGTLVWSGGAWVVTWQEHTGADTDHLLARRVGADGEPIGEPIVVVDLPRVANAHLAAGDRDIGVVWQRQIPIATGGASVELEFARLVCDR